MLTIFSYQKSSIFFVLILDAVQIRRNFFPLGNPPYAKKSKRDSLYFDLLPGPFKSAIIFLLLFVYVINDNKKKRERQYNGYEFFICFYFYLFNTILK